MNKLELLIADIPLDLGDTSLPLELFFKTQLFEVLDGSKVFNSTLPATPRNDEAFQYKRKLLNGKPTAPSFEVTIRYGGITLFNGLLLVKQATRISYEISIGIGNGEFYNLSKDLKLKDCTYEDIYYGSSFKASAHFNQMIIASAGATHTLSLTAVLDPFFCVGATTVTVPPAAAFYIFYINFTFEVTGSIDGRDIIFELVENVSGTSLGKLHTHASYNTGTGLSLGYGTIIYKPKYFNVGDNVTLKMITPAGGWTSTVGFTFSASSIQLFQADFMADLLVVNDSLYPTSKFAIYPVWNPQFYYQITQGAIPHELETYAQNPIQISTAGPSYSFLHSKPYPITPFFYLAYVIEKAIASTGWSLEYNWQAKTAQWKDITIYNNYDVSGYVEYVLSQGKLVINAKNHVPDLTVWELLHIVCDALNLIPVYDTQNKRIRLEDGEQLADEKNIQSWEDASQEYITYPDDAPKNYKIIQNVEQDAFSVRQFENGSNGGWIINADVANFNALPTSDAVGSVRRTIADGQYYWKKDTFNWDLFSTVIPAYITGENAEELQQMWMSLYMTGFHPVTVNAGTEQIYSPECAIDGQSVFHTGVPNELKNLRLLFYRGRTECVMNVSTINIPLGSSTPARKEQPGAVTLQSGINTSLWYDADHFLAGSGLVAQRYAKTIAWLAKCKPVEIYKKLTPAEIKQIKSTNKFEVAGGLVTVKSIETELLQDEVTISTIKGLIS